MKKLEELKQKKLRQKINYLKTELEETNLIFDKSLITFQNDFREHFSDMVNSKSKDTQVKKEVEYDIPKKEVNKVFKKIATKTHPDKTRGSDDSDRLEELYKEAQQSVDNKDWSRIVEIADELDIDIKDIKKDDSVFLQSTINGIEHKIKKLKQTYAWIWEHTDEDKKKYVKEKIIQDISQR